LIQPSTERIAGRNKSPTSNVLLLATVDTSLSERNIAGGNKPPAHSVVVRATPDMPLSNKETYR
jgi:hypothetical protein